MGKPPYTHFAATFLHLKICPDLYFLTCIYYSLHYQQIIIMLCSELVKVGCKNTCLACHAMQLRKSRASASRAMRTTRARAARSTDNAADSYLITFRSTHLSELSRLRMFTATSQKTRARRSIPWRIEEQPRDDDSCKKTIN